MNIRHLKSGEPNKSDFDETIDYILYEHTYNTYTHGATLEEICYFFFFFACLIPCLVLSGVLVGKNNNTVHTRAGRDFFEKKFI